jgi:hypothetical protein
MKNFKIMGLACTVLFASPAFTGCTDLDETIYSSIMTDNYYNNETDVVNSALRPFNKAFRSCLNRQLLQELPADQIGTWGRDGWWWDGGDKARIHYHTWETGDGFVKSEWTGLFEGIGYCNSVMEDLAVLDPASVGMTREEVDHWIYQNRTLRAWFYLRALDMFRNVPLATSIDKNKYDPRQLPPRDMFDFIETELTECLSQLPAKQGAGGNGDAGQGVWTKAGAAALLMRLHFNAEVYIGETMYDECEKWAQDILDGDYGSYSLGQTWDKVFDWDNIDSPEIIFAFPGSYASNSYLYWGEIARNSVPVDAEAYFGIYTQPDFNSRWAVQPGMDNAGNEFPFKLGKFVKKFQKYPADYRLIKARNLPGNSVREGMFLYGYLEYRNGEETVRVENPASMWSTIRYELYLRDQVGEFHNTPPDTMRPDLPSNSEFGDHNSGWMFAKYPHYRDGDTGVWEADYVEIRLAEVIYTLAECKFLKGDASGAATLLNSVRKRNYPEPYHAEYLYAPEGAVALTEDELRDEWGREFLAEGRRRTDLIRWGLFSSEEWWDKKPDADSHTEIYPIPRDVLNADRSLVQNPGYTN